MFAYPLILCAFLFILVPIPREPEPDERGQGFFGVRLVDNGGVSITTVEPHSPAEKAGILANDIVTAINSTKVATVNETREVISKLRPGTIVRIEVNRGEKRITLKLKVGVKPEIVP